MVPGPTSSIPGGFLAAKIAIAEKNKDALLNALNRLTQISYEKGTRDGDAAIRERVRGLVAEAEQYYRMARSFIPRRAGDLAMSTDVLDFFEARFLERSSLRQLAEELQKEIDRQADLDRRHNLQHADDGYLRKINAYVADLKKDVADWERVLSFHAEPLLRRYIDDMNEIILYHRLERLIQKMLTNQDVFIRSGSLYDEFKASLGRFARVAVLVSGTIATERDIVEAVNQALQRNGFRAVILRARNMNPDILQAVYSEVIAEHKLVPLAASRGAGAQKASEALAAAEKKHAVSTFDPAAIKDIIEDLCYLEDRETESKPDTAMPVNGLADRGEARYLFHSPGTFDISLKFISEYMRNSLIHLLDWVMKEIQRSPSSARYLAPILETAPSIRSFIKTYGMALDISSRKSNQEKTLIGGRERHYIPRQLARSLVQVISDNCVSLRRSLIDAAYNVSNLRDSALAKKISVMQETCNQVHAKINKGLSEIEKP